MSANRVAAWEKSLRRSPANRHRWLLAFVFIGMSWLVGSPGARAEDFVIETTISFSQEEDGSLSSSSRDELRRSITIFHNHRVYDFPLDRPLEVVILNLETSEFTLLDGKTLWKTAISREELLEFTADLRLEARRANRILRFMADPRFTNSWDEASQRLDLTSDQMSYRVQAADFQASEEALEQYHQFADWYARMNSTALVTHPPFARIELNQQMFDHAILPSAVRLELELPNAPFVAVSRHQYRWEITPEDQQRIDRAEELLGNSEEVSFSRYRDLLTEGETSTRR